MPTRFPRSPWRAGRARRLLWRLTEAGGGRGVFGETGANVLTLRFHTVGLSLFGESICRLVRRIPLIHARPAAAERQGKTETAGPRLAHESVHHAGKLHGVRNTTTPSAAAGRSPLLNFRRQDPHFHAAVLAWLSLSFPSHLPVCLSHGVQPIRVQINFWRVSPQRLFDRRKDP
jgi:hypothetical protein